MMGTVRRLRRGPCTAVPCLARATGAGAEAAPRQKAGGTAGPPQRQAGRRRNEGAAFPSGGGTSTRRADAPARTQSGCSWSPELVPARYKDCLRPGVRRRQHPSWCHRGAQNSAEDATVRLGLSAGRRTVPRPSPQHPLTARLWGRRRLQRFPAARSILPGGERCPGRSHRIALSQHLSRSCLRRTPSCRFPISFFPTQLAPPFRPAAPLSARGR